MKNNRTLGWVNWLISKLIDRPYWEEFFGDLQEMYEDRRESKSKLYAIFMYWFDAFHLLIGFSSFRIFKTQNNFMIRNMFKVAWRNAVRHGQFTVLNMLGLTIGIATCITLGLYVHYEMTYDTFHTKADRIYRVNQSGIWGNWNEMISSTGPNVATALRNDAPEFEEITRIHNIGAQTVKYGTDHGEIKSYNEKRCHAVEDNFMKVFSFEFFKGNPATALSQPNSVVMTNATARRYFGFEEALGKTLEIKDWEGKWQTHIVTGIVADVPGRSHIQFDMLLSLSTFQEEMDAWGWKWIWTAFSTYGLVKEGTDVEALNAKIQAIPPKWAPPTTEKIFNQSFEEFTAGNPWKLELQPLREAYIAGHPVSHVFGPTGNPLFVKIFGAIGILVLILSSINFMNLTTAKSANRGKEVGVRKVLGSMKGGLIRQFIFESSLFVAAGTLMALLLVQISLPWFNTFTDNQLTLTPYLTNPVFIGVAILFVIVLGLIAGSYPAFYLSSFKPIDTLKGKIRSGFKSKYIRNGLVVFQFSISITLIICTFFVQKQLAYSASLDVGFAKDNILQIHNIEQLGFDTEALKHRLKQNPAFTKVGKSFGVPPEIWTGDRYKLPGDENSVAQFRNLRTEEDYLDLLGLEFLIGSNFDPQRPTDRYKVILNEEAVKTLGWGTKEMYRTDSPIGKRVALASGNEAEFEVLGVVKNFNYNSVKDEIYPLIIIHHQNDSVWDHGAGLSYYSMRLNPETVKDKDDLQHTINDVKKAILEVDPSVPFEYSFTDQGFEQTFKAEQTMSQVMNVFTLMALIIACLGLFGLAAFSAEQRSKELGIRKVLGARVTQLVVLFSSEFTRLIIIAILVAVPAAYFLVQEWLSDFVYRTPVEPWVFAVATLSALVIAIGTISYQSVTAAFKNPVETLKDE
ncbi:MAG: ABC transporter permease [Bacteroidota bacterium]